MEYPSSARVKKEDGSDEQDGACGWTEDMAREFTRASREVKHRLRTAAGEMAREAGMTPLAVFHAGSPQFRNVSPVEPREGSRHRGTSRSAAPVKTPKYSGKSDWEAFHAQFELLATAEEWSRETKALQLALCLTDDALSCLLLLTPEDRHDYEALVGALQRRFGHCLQPELLRNELNNRCRKSGEPLRLLANDIESLTRWAYAHMPPGVQSRGGQYSFKTISRYFRVICGYDILDGKKKLNNGGGGGCCCCCC